MDFRFNPRFRLGGIAFGKRGASVRTGIPGLTFGVAYGQFSENNQHISTVAPYGLLTLIKNIIGFTVLIIIASVFWSVVNKWLGLAVTLFFLVRVYPPLFNDFAYGYKNESVYASDRRYKTGQRYNGSRLVIDKSVKIPYSDRQRLLSRTEGTIKLVILGTMLLLLYFNF